MNLVEEMREIISTGEQIKNKIKRHLEIIQDSHCDKHGMGFNKDNRFSSAKLSISIDAYRGFYGNSSCSTIPIVRNRELFSEFFVKVLNRRFIELMTEVANEIIKHGYNKKDGAISELEATLKELKQIP